VAGHGTGKLWVSGQGNHTANQITLQYSTEHLYISLVEISAFETRENFSLGFEKIFFRIRNKVNQSKKKNVFFDK